MITKNKNTTFITLSKSGKNLNNKLFESFCFNIWDKFFENLPTSDKVILMTARKEEFIPALKKFLKENNIHYDYLLTDMPMGERILVNDRKPSGLNMAHAVNKNRDCAFDVTYKINEGL